MKRVTRRKGEYSKSRLNREFPHQVILPADRCTGANGAAMDNFCTNLALGPRHHSLFYEDRWHLVYCFANAAHADLFRERFGGESLNPEARGRGRNWHLLHGRSFDRNR
jgi:hypothetical protein